MAGPYSQDLRERVIAAVEEEGLSRHEAARRFRISASCAIKWLQHYRKTGGKTARAMGGDRRSVLPPHRDFIAAIIEAKSEITLLGLSERLVAEKGVRADASMLWRFMKAEGLSFKKSLFAEEQERPDVAAKRRAWRRRQRYFSAERLVFIDETGAATNMVRRHGWGPKGRRVKGVAPHGHWKTTTFVGGLRTSGVIAPMVTDGPMNGALFKAYVETFLARELKPGDIVIMDNLSSHKSKDAEAAIRKAGARLIFLPPYSPDLNPIEMLFSKLKTLLRKAAERTQETLWRRIGILLDEFKPEECQNYIRHAGYA